MILFQPIVCWTATLLSLSAGRGGDDLAGRILMEKGDALYGRADPEGSVEKLCDGAHYIKADRPGGGFVYVLHRYDDRRAWLTVLECDAQGNLQRVRTVNDERLQRATAILDAMYLPDGRLFIVTHVNPSLDVAVALGPMPGEQLVMLGDDFTWDKTGRHIAYFLEPRYDAEENVVSQLWVDGRKVCDAPTSDIGDLSWDDAGTRLTATFAQPGKKDMTMVIRTTDGVAVTRVDE